MAKNTAKEYRNQVMYSVFVRNHSVEGTFEAVRRDLERIKALGVDVIWLMPVHPIGKTARKARRAAPTRSLITGRSTRTTARWRISGAW